MLRKKLNWFQRFTCDIKIKNPDASQVAQVNMIGNQVTFDQFVPIAIDRSQTIGPVTLRPRRPP